MYRPLTNPYATPAMVGTQQQAPDLFVDVPFDYVFDKTLAASEQLNSESVPIDNDSDFMLRGIQLGTGANTFRFLIYDTQGYYLSDELFPSAILFNNFRYIPLPIIPELPFPAGSAIGIRIENTDAVNPLTVQLIFKGVKRYYKYGGR